MKQLLKLVLIIVFIFCSCKNGTIPLVSEQTIDDELICLDQPPPTVDSLKIAFWSNRDNDYDIFIMDIDGKNIENITREVNKSFQPLFTPDGRNIVFVSSVEPNTREFFIYNIINKELKQLTNTGALYSYFDISNDGCKMVFNEVGTSSIWIMDIDGNNINRLTGSAINFYPKFSPDGNQIVFVSGRDHEWNDNVYIMNSDGSNPIRLTESDRDDTFPAFTPDGKKIIYSTRDPNRDNQRDIFLLDLEDGAKINLTEGIGDNGGPSCTTDGKKICFVSSSDSGRDIYIMDITGQNKTRLTYSGDNAGFDISYDNSKIVFTSERDGNEEIYIMDIDGSNQVRLTYNSAHDGQPIIP